MFKDFARTYLRNNARNQYILFGLAWTVVDAIMQPLGSVAADDVHFGVFVAVALLTCAFFSARWAMMIFTALVVGSVAVVLVDMGSAGFERAAPNAGPAAIAIYTVLAVFLLVLTHRAMKGGGGGGRKAKAAKKRR